MSDMKNQATFDCLFDRNDESMKKMDSILGVQRRGGDYFYTAFLQCKINKNSIRQFN